jgi:hypothetical protein
VRRAFLLLLLALLAAGALAWLVRADAGYVLLQYGHTRVETTLWFGLLLLFALHRLNRSSTCRSTAESSLTGQSYAASRSDLYRAARLM